MSLKECSLVYLQESDAVREENCAALRFYHAVDPSCLQYTSSISAVNPNGASSNEARSQIEPRYNTNSQIEPMNSRTEQEAEFAGDTRLFLAEMIQHAHSQRTGKIEQLQIRVAIGVGQQIV